MALAARAAIALAGLGVATATVGDAAVRSPARQSGQNDFTTPRRGAATGTRLHISFRNPENPSQKPHTLKRLVIRYPAGTRFDAKAAPQCHASDAELQSDGAAACPPASKVGGGFAVSDTGSPGPFPPRYSRTTISQFNGDGEVIGVGENDEIPAIKTVTRTKLKGNTSSTEFPTFPGAGPPDPYVPFKRLVVDFPARQRGKHALTRTPKRCPKSRRWTIVTKFTYVDGATERLVSRSPCRRRHG